MDLKNLQKEILKCRECFELFDPFPVVHPNIDSKVVIISQALSYNVKITNKHWNDQSGKKLINDWFQITEDQFYNFSILDLAHCYPGKNKYGKDNNPPKICFEKWVSKELELLNNNIFIIIGAQAAKRFFPKNTFKDLVYKNQLYKNKTTIVLPHPSPLNCKWFKDNPEFDERLKEIRNILKNNI